MATRFGTSGPDRFIGTDAADFYDGLGGDDYILGGGGWTDELRGGAGNDTIDLQTGNGKAWGGIGNDTVKATRGSTVNIYGEDGNDLLEATAGWAKLEGGNGNDRILGGDATSFMRGDAGNDVLVWQAFGRTGYEQSIHAGGTGTDTLHLDTHAKIHAKWDDMTTPLIDPVATFVMSDTGSQGEMFYTSNLAAALTPENSQGFFSEFETIYNGKTSTAQIRYDGGAADMKVIGGAKDDVFESGAGDEIFTGSGGRDRYVFDFSEGPLGSDRIEGFAKWQDVPIIENADGLRFTKVNVGTHTVVTATDASGQQMLHLDIDAIGLPRISEWTDTIG